MSEGTCFSPSWLSPAPEVRRTSCRSGLQAQQWHSHSWLCAFSAQLEAPDLQFILSLEGSGERRFSSAADHAITNTNGFSHGSALLPLPRHLRFVHPGPRFGPSAGVRRDSRLPGMLLRDRLRGNLRTIVRPPHDEISLRFCREATHPRLRTCRRPRIQRVRLCPTCLFSRQERLVPPMRLFIVAFYRLEQSLSYCWVKGWLVGAVGIEKSTISLKPRKTAVLRRPYRDQSLQTLQTAPLAR